MFYLFLIVLCVQIHKQCYANVDMRKVRNEEVLIMQFDSRPLKGYWLTSALWNNYYATKHNHTFVYYSSKSECAHGLEPLASPWCKVKAMLQVDNDFPRHKIFIYMDSDAVINKRYLDTSVPEFAAMMQKELQWNPTKRPLVFNQDGKCWWCTLVERVGYTMCLNAGTVMWYKNPISNQLLQQWWDASLDPYEGNPIKRFVYVV